MITANVSSAGRQQRRAVDRAGRDPRGGHRRHLAGRRPVLPGGTIVGALIIQTLTTTVYAIGHPAADDAAVQGGRRHRRLPPPGPGVPRPAPSPAARRRPGRPRRSRRRRTGDRHDHRTSLHRRPPVLAAAGSPRAARPGPGHPRACCWSCTASACRSTAGFSNVQVDLQPLHRQRVPARRRGRDDLRDPHRRHRPVASARWSRCPRWCRPPLLQAGWPAALVLRARAARSARPSASLMGCVIHFFEIQPFIVTLAGMFFARGLCTSSAVDSISDHRRLLDRHRPGADRDPAGQLRRRPACSSRSRGRWSPRTCWHYTRFGRNVYAIGGNEQSALLMGLPVARTRIAVYTISGLCSAHRRHPARPSTRSPAAALHRASAWSSTPSPRS